MAFNELLDAFRTEQATGQFREEQAAQDEQQPGRGGFDPDILRVIGAAWVVIRRYSQATDPSRR